MNPYGALENLSTGEKETFTFKGNVSLVQPLSDEAVLATLDSAQNKPEEVLEFNQKKKRVFGKEGKVIFTVHQDSTGEVLLNEEKWPRVELEVTPPNTIFVRMQNVA